MSVCVRSVAAIPATTAAAAATAAATTATGCTKPPSAAAVSVSRTGGPQLGEPGSRYDAPTLSTTNIRRAMANETTDGLGGSRRVQLNQAPVLLPAVRRLHAWPVKPSAMPPSTS